jgi:protein-S-isoprenylcysteine O-methyltransferase Ste14
MTTATPGSSAVTAWRHARAVGLLPFTNTVVIPGALLTLWPPPVRAVDAASVALLLAGSLLMLCGIALVAHTIGLFVRLGRGTLAPWDPTRELVVAGAYRYSRNPMKAGLFLVLAGEAAVLRSPALAAWLVSFALVNIIYIRLHEEPGLVARFGDRYREYCARVPRWWPTARGSRNHATEVTTP